MDPRRSEMAEEIAFRAAKQLIGQVPEGVDREHWLIMRAFEVLPVVDAVLDALPEEAIAAIERSGAEGAR